MKKFPGLLCSLFVLLSEWGCATMAEVSSPQPGSIDRPFCSDGAMAQRQYLRRLRTESGAPVESRREEPIMGPAGHLLDPYVVQREGLPFWAGWFRGEIGVPPGDHPLRIYMDLYRPGCAEDRSPPGFKLALPGQSP